MCTGHTGWAGCSDRLLCRIGVFGLRFGCFGDFGGGCYSGSARLQNDVNDDIEQEEAIKAEETCPQCGFSKFSTEDLCSSCKRKVTCPECGGRKDKYEDLCYSCEANKEEDKE